MFPEMYRLRSALSKFMRDMSCNRHEKHTDGWHDRSDIPSNFPSGEEKVENVNNYYKLRISNKRDVIKDVVKYLEECGDRKRKICDISNSIVDISRMLEVCGDAEVILDDIICTQAYYHMGKDILEGCISMYIRSDKIKIDNVDEKSRNHRRRVLVQIDGLKIGGRDVYMTTYPPLAYILRDAWCHMNHDGPATLKSVVAYTTFRPGDYIVHDSLIDSSSLPQEVRDALKAAYTFPKPYSSYTYKMNSTERGIKIDLTEENYSQMDAQYGNIGGAFTLEEISHNVYRII